MHRLEAAEAVGRMQQFIEDNLTQPITLIQLAQSAGYSPFHSARLFKEYAGKTPFEYIRALRLSRSAMVLRDTHSRIVDVALDFLFNSHEGYTKAFSREFGIAPARYKKEAPPIKLFLPNNARISYLTFNSGDKKMKQKKQTVFVQVIERPARKALIKRGVAADDYFQYCEEVGCDIWGMLLSVKQALYEPVGMWLPDKLIKKRNKPVCAGSRTAAKL